MCIVGNAVLGYGIAKGKEAVEELISFLDNPMWSIKISAIKSLGDIGDARAIKPLTRKLDDTEDSIAPYARQALNKINKKE